MATFGYRPRAARGTALPNILCAVSLSLAIAAPLRADVVTLENRSAGIAITGELEAFENGIYRIQSDFGEFNISAKTVDCVGEACPTLEPSLDLDFRVYGSDTVGAELFPLLLRGYAESQGALVETQPGRETRQFIYEAIADEGFGDTLFRAFVEDRGSSTGFRALISGEADIGMSSRRVRREEVIEARSAGLGNLTAFAQEHAFAADGLLIAVHPDNPVTALSEDQVSQLLAGRIVNWSELGGPDLPVTVYSRNADSGTFATIADRFLRPFNRELGPAAQILPGNTEISRAIYADPGAIGYVGFAFRNDAKPIDLIQSCGIVSPASAFGAKTGEYPLQRSLYLYTPESGVPEAAQAVVDFANSDAAAPFIAKSGFIDYTIAEATQDSVQGALRAAMDASQSAEELNLMRELFIDLLEYRRLSSTFRFRTASSQLDNASLRDLRRLAAYLEGLPAEAEIALVGFTDSVGNFEANRALSVARAAGIRDELNTLTGGAFADRAFTIKGFGELAPVGCNDQAAGQQLNRRVEVWVRM